MKFLLDQGVPLRAAALLREGGMNAVHTSEVGLASADDSDILKWRLENEAVVVTLDADFHASIALSRRQAPSAIRFRIQGLKGPEVAQIVAGLAPLARLTELRAGALFPAVRLDGKSEKTMAALVPRRLVIRLGKIERCSVY